MKKLIYLLQTIAWQMLSWFCTFKELMPMVHQFFEGEYPKKIELLPGAQQPKYVSDVIGIDSS